MQTCRVSEVARQDMAVKVGYGMDGQFWRGVSGLCAVRPDVAVKVRCGMLRFVGVRCGEARSGIVWQDW